MVRPVERPDAALWLELRCALWPASSRMEHADEIARFFDGRAREPLAVLIATTGTGSAIGFAELSIRAGAEGCNTDRVAYLEGWYVAEPFRRIGVGASLLRAAEAWARAQGCTEMASDTWIDADVSQRAHEALGFEVVDRCVNYRKAL